MKRLKTANAVCLIASLLAVAGFSQEAPAPGEAAAPQEIQMTAKKYEFNPNVITARKGEIVRLIITALDRDHGFKIQEFGIDQKLMKGAPTAIEFTADKSGTFEFKCSNFCGFGHGRMKGKLVVEE
ncbi:MAG: cupredoxin domain-containing protein [Acidobacteria bacterium]|nr:cupredoxin domain-containing protein [Acidobacteriota bacterium]